MYPKIIDNGAILIPQILFDMSVYRVYFILCIHVCVYSLCKWSNDPACPVIFLFILNRMYILLDDNVSSLSPLSASDAFAVLQPVENMHEMSDSAKEHADCCRNWTAGNSVRVNTCTRQNCYSSRTSIRTVGDVVLFDAAADTE